MSNKNINTTYYRLIIVILLPSLVILTDVNDNKRFNSNKIQFMSSSKFGTEGNGYNVSGSVVHAATNRTYSLAEALRLTFVEFEVLFESIVDIIAKNVPKISRDTEIFLMKLSNHTVDILNTLSNKIINEDNSIFGETFTNVERQLESVKNEFENLAISVDEHFNWAVTQLNQTLINHTEEYDWWTAQFKQKLRSVNDTKLYQEGCKIIDEFIYNSTKELHNCCKITMTPMRTLCKSTASLINEALQIIVDVIDRMQSCLEEKNSYLNYLLPCIHLAYDEISNLVSRAAQMTHLVNNMLPMKIIYTKSCFAIVRVDMKVRRNSIESSMFKIK